jgi:predicted transcriptional regulator
VEQTPETHPSEEEVRFIEAVNLGIAAAERGEFVEHEEVWANVEKILRS